MSPFLEFVLVFLGLILFATAQLWLGAKLVRAEHRGWGRAARAAVICLLLSLPISMLFGRSPLADLVTFLVGAAVIQRVLVTTTWRALALSLALYVFNLLLALTLTGETRLLVGPHT